MYVLHPHKYIIDWGCEGEEWGCDTCDTVYPFSGNSLRDFCLRKKIPELYHNVPDLCSEIRTEPRHGTMAHCTCFPETPYEKSVQKRDPGNGTQSAIVPGSNSRFWTKGQKVPCFRKSLTRNLYRKKIPEIVRILSFCPDFSHFESTHPHIIAKSVLSITTRTYADQ